jgi:hypothetical protein
MEESSWVISNHSASQEFPTFYESWSFVRSKAAVYRVMTPCSLIDSYQHFKWTWCLHLQRRHLLPSLRYKSSSTLEIEATGSSRILITTIQIIQSHNPEHCLSYSGLWLLLYNFHCFGNVKSHWWLVCLQECTTKLSQRFSSCQKLCVTFLSMLDFCRLVLLVPWLTLNLEDHTFPAVCNC